MPAGMDCRAGLLPAFQPVAKTPGGAADGAKNVFETGKHTSQDHRSDRRYRLHRPGRRLRYRGEAPLTTPASDPPGPRVFPVAPSVVLGAWRALSDPSRNLGRLPVGTSAAARSGRAGGSGGLRRAVRAGGLRDSIFLLTLAVAMLFGAPLKWAVAGGIGHALLWWFVFDWLLEVYLPVGLIR